MKLKNLDIAIEVAELLEKGSRSLFVNRVPSEDVVIKEFPIINVYQGYIELIDPYESVKIKRKKAYRGPWPKGNTKILPTQSEIDLMRRNFKKIEPYIKLPREYWTMSDKFWVIYRGGNTILPKDRHYASYVMTVVAESVPDYEDNWIIEVIR